MKIHNFRAGFATNSSSSHSIILLPPEQVGKVSPIDADITGFGWSFFRLVSEEDKLRYMAAQCFSNGMDIQTVIDKLKETVPDLNDIDPTENRHEIDMYVDHQSVLDLGQKWTSAHDRLIKFFKSPQVVVLGGNDNSDYGDNGVSGAKEVEFFKSLMTDGSGGQIIREDGDYMIAFNQNNGTKIRFSFNENDTECADYVKACAPELVDLKITNYCAEGCSFCYQASTLKGRHAPLADIKRHIDLLADMGVFEVAIGGGEPTDHPDFVEILHYVVEHGMVPNFTTLSSRWLSDDAIVNAVALTVGGIGVSCHDAASLDLVTATRIALRGRKYPGFRYAGPMVSAQHVIGSVPLTQTGDFISAAFAQRIGILLLGYKEIGFGKTFDRYDGGDVPLALQMMIEGKNTSSVSVDTALVDQYPELLRALNVPQALVTSPEGKFSCYIDAVMDKMGPSSYVEPKTMTRVPATAEEFKKIFAGY